MHPYEQSIADAVNKAADRDIYFHPDEIMQLPGEQAAEIIKIFTEWACRPTNILPITISRDCFKQLPAEWVSPLIKKAALDSEVDMHDDWDYRRLLELCRIISPELLKWALTLNDGSDNTDIAEAIEDAKDWL